MTNTILGHDDHSWISGCDGDDIDDDNGDYSETEILHQEMKGAGASEAGGQTKEGPLSKRYFQTSKIAQNRTKSPVPIVIDVFGVTAPYGNPYGSKIAIVWLFFVIF